MGSLRLGAKNGMGMLANLETDNEGQKMIYLDIYEHLDGSYHDEPEGESEVVQDAEVCPVCNR